MSLLGRKAPHTVQVQNQVMVRNERGLPVLAPSGALLPVKCMVEPVRDWSQAEETAALGLQIVDLRVVRARTWPGDVLSLILWEGDWYETVGAPQHHSVSKRTGHYRVTIKWLRKDG